MIYEMTKNGYHITTDQTKLDVPFIHNFLKDSYWSPGIPYKTVIKALKNSLCFGVYNKNKQIGFARLVTDYTSFSYLADVFIDESERGKGLSKWLMKIILEHPEIKNQRRLMLATYDAHSLYEQFGFNALDRPEIFMQKTISDPFKIAR